MATADDQWIAVPSEKILFLLSAESLAVPVERMWGLVLKLRPVPGALRARAKIERALNARASAVFFDRPEKTALLDALNAWMDDGGVKALGPDLAYLRSALGHDLGVA
jgi:hypothetical protein